MTDKLAQEKAPLQKIETRPFVPRALGYIKLSGLGLLQSAMPLGAGSAAVPRTAMFSLATSA